MSTSQDYRSAWREEHDAREERLRSPHGWLAITSIRWLTDEPERFEDVPGAWSYDARGAVVVLDQDERLTLDESLLTEGRHELGPIDPEGLRLSFGVAVAEVAQRNGATLLRPRHPDAPARLAYLRTPTYELEARWAMPGRFEPYPATDGLVGVDEEVAVGEVVFEYAGSEHRLVAWGEEDGALWVLFRDATSGVTTYGASRQLLLTPPAPDGSVEIDFNRATNLPCAYTVFATCPVPPAANTLGFAVEAGEQVPLFAGPDA